jgi:hypothetical protein
MITFTNLGNQGRLANQMFQIAGTVGLAIRNNDQYILPPWAYENDFNLHGCFSSTIKPTKTYAEPHFHFIDIPHRETQNEVLDLPGFWQSWRYFEHCKDVIIGLLTPTNLHPIRWGTTSIHIRRCDYAGQYKNAFAQIGLDYYHRAMEVVRSPKYLIVSDDIPWCKQNFRGEQFEFSDGKSEIEDLKIQISCANNIIANSSFSWFGAYLNKNPSKQIVAPRQWFGAELAHHDTKDLIPEGWHKI